MLSFKMAEVFENVYNKMIIIIKSVSADPQLEWKCSIVKYCQRTNAAAMQWSTDSNQALSWPKGHRRLSLQTIKIHYSASSHLPVSDTNRLTVDACHQQC